MTAGPGAVRGGKWGESSEDCRAGLLIFPISATFVRLQLPPPCKAISTGFPSLIATYTPACVGDLCLEFVGGMDRLCALLERVTRLFPHLKRRTVWKIPGSCI